MKTYKVDLKLAQKMAKSVARQINYVGLDAPSSAPYSNIEEIVGAYSQDWLDTTGEAALWNKFSEMKFGAVMALETKVNQLLESGKYD